MSQEPHEDIKMDEALYAMGFREVDLGVEGVQCYQVDMDQMRAAAAEDYEALSKTFGEPIDTYTRRAAIEDGVLIEVDRAICSEAGIPASVALTAEAWAEFVEMNPEAEAACNDEPGRLWDVLWMFRCAAAGAMSTELIYEFYCVVSKTSPFHKPCQDMGGASLVKLKAVIGPDDDGSVCFTLMLPNQD